MRRVFLIVIAFSLFLSGCQQTFTKKTNSFSVRNEISFTGWEIPGYFIPQQIKVLGLGDSLTQGVGDELKREGYFGRVTSKMADWKGVKDVDVTNLAKRGRRSDQLITKLDDRDIQLSIKNADFIFLTIGGNDVMKVVKSNLFNLKMGPFYIELGKFEIRLDELLSIIRDLNGDAIIILSGLYNPLSIVTDEANEFDDIIDDWNEAIEVRTNMDERSCFIPVSDLFDSNTNMVYHTDFFHPNAKGYEELADRYLEKLQQCNLKKLSDGELEM